MITDLVLAPGRVSGDDRCRWRTELTQHFYFACLTDRKTYCIFALKKLFFCFSYTFLKKFSLHVVTAIKKKIFFNCILMQLGISDLVAILIKAGCKYGFKETKYLRPVLRTTTTPVTKLGL